MSEGPVLRVATMNVLAPANPDWARRRRVLARALQSLDPDVVALQEVPVAQGQETVEELLGPGYHVLASARTSPDGVGAALATRWPHRLVEDIDQRCTERAAALPWCATQIVQVDTPVGSMLVAHHKPSWQFGGEYEREQQALTAVRALERHAPFAEHVLVLGDFDAVPDAASMRFWRGLRSLDGVSACYQDAWETVRPGEAGFTFTAENPLVRAGQMETALPRRIDYVLVRAGDHGPSLRVVSCDRILDAAVEGIWASDHFGVVAGLARPASPPGTWDPAEVEALSSGANRRDGHGSQV